MLSTEQLAELAHVKPATIRTQLCRHGHYCGLRPIKLPNRFLAWPDDSLERLLAGNTEGEKQNGEGGAA